MLCSLLSLDTDRSTDLPSRSAEGGSCLFITSCSLFGMICNLVKLPSPKPEGNTWTYMSPSFPSHRARTTQNPVTIDCGPVLFQAQDATYACERPIVDLSFRVKEDWLDSLPSVVIYLCFAKKIIVIRPCHFTYGELQATAEHKFTKIRKQTYNQRPPIDHSR